MQPHLSIFSSINSSINRIKSAVIELQLTLSELEMKIYLSFDNQFSRNINNEMIVMIVNKVSLICH